MCPVSWCKAEILWLFCFLECLAWSGALSKYDKVLGLAIFFIMPSFPMNSLLPVLLESLEKVKWSESEMVTQFCLTSLWHHGLYSLSDSSVHGILQARILEWVDTFPSPGDLLDPRLKPESPALQADSLPSESLKFHLLTFQCPYFISGKVGSCLLKKCSSTLLFVFVLFFGKETSF